MALTLDEDLSAGEKVNAEKLKTEDVTPPEESPENEDKKEPPVKKTMPLEKAAVVPVEPETSEKKEEKKVDVKGREKEEKAEKPLPTKVWGHVFVTFFNEYNESVDLIKTETNLRYLGVGGEYNKKYLTVIKYGYQLKAKIGLPIFKDEYKVPYSHVLRGHYFISDIWKRFSIYAGGEQSTLFSVNIPTFGEGLKLIDNTILWAFLGSEFLFNSEKMKLSYEYASSLGVSNQMNRTFQANRHQLTFWSKIFGSFGLGVSGSVIEGAGDFTISAQNYELLMTCAL